MENQFYKDIILHAPIAYVCHKIHYNQKGEGIGSSITEANNSFATLCNLDLESLQHKCLTEVLPQLKQISGNWSQMMAEVTESGITKEFTYQQKENGNWICLQLYSPFAGHCVTLFDQIRKPIEVTEKLTESEEKYRFLTENIQDVIWTLDLESRRFNFVSSSVEKLRGYTLDEVMAQKADETLTPDSLAYFLKVIPERFKNYVETRITKYYTDELEQPCKDGTTIWTEAITYFWTNPRTQRVEVIGTSRDISERKAAVDKLKTSERRLSTLINNLNGVVYRCQNNPEWSMEYFSDGILDLTGYERSDFINNKVRSYNSIIHPDDRENVWNTVQTAVGDQTFYKLEYRILKADGNIAWVWENGCGVFKDGDLVSLEGYITDISERKNAEQALKESEEKFRSVFKISPDLISITRLSDGLYVNVNDSFVRNSGYSREELIGNTAEEIGIWSDPADRQLLVNTLKKDGYIHNLEAVFNKKDGKKMIGLMSASLMNFNDEPHLLAFTRDISEQKKNQQEIQLLNETLETRVKERTAELRVVNKELEAFAYTVSHDLRAPLRAIDGFANILKEDYENLLDKEGEKVVNTIIENTSRMGTLIDDLLAFSRLSRSPINLSRVNMNQVVEQAYSEVVDCEAGKLIQFKTGHLPEIMADHALIKQVWINLISNAVKFSSKCKKPQISISAKADNKSIVFEIKDNGVGFNMKYVGKLFGVFQRLHSVREFKGTGVGLAIVQRIVMRHGGVVWAKSEPESGTSFFFTLPDAKNAN
jgi:PAS domain S-box-containing protein